MALISEPGGFEESDLPEKFKAFAGVLLGYAERLGYDASGAKRPPVAGSFSPGADKTAVPDGTIADKPEYLFIDIEVFVGVQDLVN